MIEERGLPICRDCTNRRLEIIEGTLFADSARVEDAVTVQCEFIDACARAYSMGLYDGRERYDKTRD